MYCEVATNLNLRFLYKRLYWCCIIGIAAKFCINMGAVYEDIVTWEQLYGHEDKCLCSCVNYVKLHIT